MHKEGRELTTADLARRHEEVRARADERMEDPKAGEASATRAQAERATQRSPAAPAATAGHERGAPASRDVSERAVLFPADESERLRMQWSDIQATFVDTPREAVERADALVAAVMQRLAEVFAGERANMEQQWDRGDNVTTEDLRVALQRYRAFFDRLLAV